MANYTNQVPAKLSSGDQLTFNPQGNGNYILPRGEYQITVASAPGGSGETERAYTASMGAVSDPNKAVHFYGGKGGAGISATFRIAFDKETAIAVATGTIGQGVGGTGYYGYYGDETFSHKGATGGSGGSGVFKANGTVVAQVSGGGGGGGASMYVGRATVTGAGWSRSVSGSHGSDGAQGAVLAAPTGYTTAINNAAGFIIIKVLSLNAPPSTPEPITYGLPMSNRPIELNCATSIDPDPGDTVSYVWEQRISGAGTGAWDQVAITAEPKASVIAPASGNSVTYRVKAVDNHSAESGYATGSAKAIVYNFPPVISGTDESKGDLHDPFDYSFTVDDPDADDVLTVWVYLDDAKSELLKIENAVRNKQYKVDLKENWEYVSMGAHTLIVRAIDDKGGEAFRKISFTRFSNKLEVQLREPITFKDLVLTVLPFVNATAGKDSTWLIQLKNDEATSWEDATKFNYASEIYKFVNQSKSTDPTQFQCRVTIDKGDSGGEIVFYGASFVLNANGNEVSYAQGVRINPADIEPGGVLTAEHDNVMKALNAVSLAAGKAENQEGNHGYMRATVSVCKSPLAATGGISNPDIWANDRICTVFGGAASGVNLTIAANPSPYDAPAFHLIRHVFLPKGTPEPPSYDSGDTMEAVFTGIVPCTLATNKNAGNAIYADNNTIKPGTELALNPNYGVLTTNNTGWKVATVVAPGLIKLEINEEKSSAVTYGTNANGEYWRFPDGLQICARKQFNSSTANSNSIWYYPIAFTTIPAITATGCGNTISYPYTYNAQVSYVYMKNHAANAVQDIIAIGRWK